MTITRDFYQQPTLEVAKALLGKKLVREINNKKYIGIIVETEAYIGENDTACHAAKGRTQRTEVMFGAAGHAYIYFVYGMHYMFNIVTEAQGHPSAVLIRAIEPLNQLELLKVNRKVGNIKLLTNGPAKLCQAYDINKQLNQWDLCIGKKLWLETSDKEAPRHIETSPRIGIDYAEEKDRHAHWRFTLKGNPFLSKKINPGHYATTKS